MRGIYFEPFNVEAIIEGRKTQTRRLDGLKEINQEPDKWELIRRNDDGRFLFWVVAHDPEPDPEKRYCLAKPRYQVGETVYVKEAWSEWIGTSDHLKNGVISIEEAQADVIYKSDISDWAKLLENNGNPWLIKSTLHMPEWAARYFITITDVRAERLQEITEEDADREGFSITYGKYEPWTLTDARTDFLRTWNSINRDYPWVFAYAFKQEMIRRR